MTSKEELIEYYLKSLGEHISQTPWIIAMDVLVGAVRFAKGLQELGADKVLAIGAIRGVGEIPDDMPCINLDIGKSKSMMAGIIEGEKALENLPDWAIEKVDEFDPKCEARVIRAFFSNGKPIAGRPVFGAREAAWRALEDKMIVDELWDAIGVPRAKRALISLKDPEIYETSAQLNQGSGVVWVGDNRDGWHGGAERMRWVRTREEQEEAIEFLSQFCDRVRIMPFLEGVPCSIHGWVFPEKTIGFRPCEMLVFQRTDAAKFFYAGAATNWKPKEEVRQAMVSTVVKTGEYLRKTVGYKGCFTIDGVVTTEGFLPTELNPRFGGAISRMATSIPKLPLLNLHFATMEGLELDFYPDQLRELVVTEAEAHPQIRGMILLEGVFDIEETKIGFVPDEEAGWREEDLETEDISTAVIGPGAAGAMIFIQIHSSHIEFGKSAAPTILSAASFVSNTWEIEIPKLKAAEEA